MSETANNETRAMLREYKTCVLIPTYNNAGSVATVIRDCLEYCSDIIVVNDGCTDNTADALSAFADKITVITHTKNRGKGSALVTGFKHAIASGFEYAITIDSDGQHRASDLPMFARAIMHYPGQLIVGERDLSGVDINKQSSFANKFSNFWFYVQTGRKLNDTQTGYRAYPLKHLHGLSLLTSRYEAELELLVFAAWHNVKLKSIPINVYYPPREERVSHFRPAYDFTRISILNTVLCILAIVYGMPKRIYYGLHNKNWFNGEVKMFTRKKGEQRDAALTIKRIARSLHIGAIFATLALLILTPIALILFNIGKATERKRTMLHRLMQRTSRFVAYHIPGAKFNYYANANVDFSKPSVIICNHQSQFDLMCLMMLHHKLIFLTNDWVWNNFFFGKLIKYAEYYPISFGIDNIMPNLKALVDRGYSIVVFPEGTRSETCKILRFHKGAFQIAQQLGIGVTPLYLHGAGHVMPKGELMLRKGQISLHVGDTIDNSRLQGELLPLTKRMRRMYTLTYNHIATETECAEYYLPLLFYKYAYRGWKTVSQSKKEIKALRQHLAVIDNCESRSVLIINSRQGEFALLYALANKNVEVYAAEERADYHAIAAATAQLPKNLHYICPDSPREYSALAEKTERTIVLAREQSDEQRYSNLNPILIDLK